MAIIAMFVVLLSSDVIVDVTAVGHSSSSSSMNKNNRHSRLATALRKFVELLKCVTVIS